MLADRGTCRFSTCATGCLGGLTRGIPVWGIGRGIGRRLAGVGRGRWVWRPGRGRGTGREGRRGGRWGRGGTAVLRCGGLMVTRRGGGWGQAVKIQTSGYHQIRDQRIPEGEGTRGGHPVTWLSESRWCAWRVQKKTLKHCWN